MLKRQEGKSTFGTLKRGLRLLVEDIDDKDPSDIAYVYSGYAPLSVRLVEAAVKGPGLAALPEDILKSLPGPSFSIEQTSEDEPGSFRRLPSSSCQLSPRVYLIVLPPQSKHILSLHLHLKCACLACCARTLQPLRHTPTQENATGIDNFCSQLKKS